MGTYAVAVTRCESATLYVEADDAPAAEALGLSAAEADWDADTINVQVDDVSELTPDAAAKVSSYVIGVEDDD